MGRMGNLSRGYSKSFQIAVNVVTAYVQVIPLLHQPPNKDNKISGIRWIAINNGTNTIILFLFFSFFSIVNSLQQLLTNK